MRPARALLLALGVILVIVLSASAYVVQEWDQVVITQFGDPVGDPITEAGLHFKLPFVQKVNRFEKRILIWDGERNEIPTADKRYIWVDTTARWRIRDPLLFLQAVRNESGAQLRLDDILDSATRNVISANDLIEVVRVTNRVYELAPEEDEAGTLTEAQREKIGVGRDTIVERILQRAGELAPKYGIELIDVRIKRINYTETVRNTVYQRMVSERQRIAERYRSEGTGRKAEIDGQRARDEKRVLSEAFRDAQEIIAKADADAARIYAEAYNADAEFYAFWRTLEAYKTALGKNTTLVLSPDSELYRYLSGKDRNK